MVRSPSGFSLLILVLFGFSGQMSSATAGVIPLGFLNVLDENTTSFECGNGSYKDIIRLATGRESHVCKPCFQCPCGVKVLRHCSPSTDTECTEQCEESKAVFNQTLGACVSLLGVVNCSRHAEPQSSDYTTTMVVSTYMYGTDFGTESGGDLSPLRAFGTSLGIIVSLSIGTIAIILIARKKGYLKGFFKKPDCTGSSPCNIIRTSSPKISRSLVRRKYETLLQRLSNVFTEEATPVGDRGLQMSIASIPMATEEEPLMMTSLNLPLAEDIQVSHDGEEPYWLVMRGCFTSRGGVLRCKDSDVFLEIPPGAIPESVERQEIVAKVALVTSRFDFKLKKDEVCLSPVVELLSPGLDAFDDLIVIHIPHRARMDPDWSFKVHFTRSHGKTEGGWQAVDEEEEYNPEDCKRVACQRSPSVVTFRTNKTHFVIRTPHFSKYACSGCGKKRYLNLEALVSAKYQNLPNRQQVDLNCYIVDTIKDSWHRVKENEGQRPQSDKHPIHLKSKEPLLVSLMTDSTAIGEEWAWTPETYGGKRPTSVAIPIRNIVRCCSDAVPYFVTFSLRPKALFNHTIPTALFESMVVYQQKGSSSELPISIAFDLQDQHNTVPSLSSVPSSPKCTINDLIGKVAKKIPVNKWKDLLRCLLSGEDDVETLVDELHVKYDVGEVKHQMLRIWLQRRGKDATCERLRQSLKTCGLVNIAEMIEDGTHECGSDIVSQCSSNV
eukprot:XP_011672253.1 PREDICTED: uncharacterized protein LOC100889506 isoform X2 [Strongylocentrotus purpuratus]